ncbi:hypothetical protein BGZ94_005761, partial [Podila epigama]
MRSMAIATITFASKAAVERIKAIAGNCLFVGDDSGRIVRYGEVSVTPDETVVRRLAGLPAMANPRTVAEYFAQQDIEGVDSVTMPVNVQFKNRPRFAFVRFASLQHAVVASRYKWTLADGQLTEWVADEKTMLCHQCGRPGHLIRNCPERAQLRVRQQQRALNVRLAKAGPHGAATRVQPPTSTVRPGPPRPNAPIAAPRPAGPSNAISYASALAGRHRPTTNATNATNATHATHAINPTHTALDAITTRLKRLEEMFEAFLLRDLERSGSEHPRTTPPPAPHPQLQQQQPTTLSTSAQPPAPISIPSTQASSVLSQVPTDLLTQIPSSDTTHISNTPEELQGANSQEYDSDGMFLDEVASVSFSQFARDNDPGFHDSQDYNAPTPASQFSWRSRTRSQEPKYTNTISIPSTEESRASIESIHTSKRRNDESNDAVRRLESENRTLKREVNKLTEQLVELR